MWCFEKAIFAHLKFNICIPKLGNLHTMSIFRHTLIFWVWASLDTQQPCIYTFAWSALHLPQAYHLIPSSPFHKTDSFILTNSQVWKVHIVWHFNLKLYHRENAIIVKVNGENFRILSEIFHQNMFEYSLLQHTYRLKWTALQNRHTFHKQLVNWHLQGDTWFSQLGNNCLNWTWDGIGFIVVTNVWHLEHQDIPYWNTSSLEIS